MTVEKLILRLLLLNQKATVVTKLYAYSQNTMDPVNYIEESDDNNIVSLCQYSKR